MANRIRVSVVAFLLGCGLLAQVAPASAVIIDLVRENFNDVTGIPAGGERTIADILANDPTQLPDGINFVGTVNVRAVDNIINNPSSGILGFDGHFTSNFLVLGDASGVIGGQPNQGESGISIPFIVPTNALRIAISYRDYFSGFDTTLGPPLDAFLVRVNGPGPAVPIELLLSPIDFGGGFGIAGVLDVVNFDDGDPTTILPGEYRLQFLLAENDQGTTNTAIGLDRIRVRAEVIPEPGSLLLLASGLAGLVGWRRRQSR